MVQFLKKKDGFVGLLLEHLGTSALMDLLLRLVSCVEPPGLRRDVLHVSVRPLLSAASRSASPRPAAPRGGRVSEPGGSGPLSAVRPDSPPRAPWGCAPALVLDAGSAV